MQVRALDHGAEPVRDRAWALQLEDVEPGRALDILLANTDDAYGFPPFRYFAPAITIGGEDYAALRAREQALLARFLDGITVRRIVRDDFSWAQAIPDLLGNGSRLQWPPGSSSPA